MESSPSIRGQVAAALTRERTRAGVSLSELARRAGVSKSTVSQLEAGTGNPGVETLWALSTALGIPFSRLVDPPRRSTEVVRLGHGQTVVAEEAEYAATLLAAGAAHVRRDLYVVQAEPGQPRRSDPHPPGTVEHVVLVRGRASVGPSDDPVEIGPGDYVRYPGDEPHVFVALEPATVAVLLSDQP
ncbi:transcriptional regulator with XRE-family HTH domain [Mumia flava]|uniref:Transcriptional regulator with XRE-family HTH domain n=1 Tax=Mumia flava TaxID=1348852 RepID=A0A0B2B2U6_9ACTN|nr:XRE family transcriptional regulator [Mumia flava]PJJ57802.1 transcriptional regulator with XRE-family HTH domain [Mumia flava]